MLSKPLVFTALLFQIAGIVWDFVFHFQQGDLGNFFAQQHWPIFLGFVLLLVAVIQSFQKKISEPKEKQPEKPEEKKQNLGS
jgi:hypothetical protein